jgi:hypothetical protein
MDFRGQIRTGVVMRLAILNTLGLSPELLLLREGSDQ